MYNIIYHTIKDKKHAAHASQQKIMDEVDKDSMRVHIRGIYLFGANRFRLNTYSSARRYQVQQK